MLVLFAGLGHLPGIMELFIPLPLFFIPIPLLWGDGAILLFLAGLLHGAVLLTAKGD